MYKTSFKKNRTKIPVNNKKSHLKLWLFIIFILLCIGGAIYFCNLPRYQIKDIKIEDAVITDESSVKTIAGNYLDSSYFFVIPRSHFWFYPKGYIKEEIEALPSIIKATVSVNSEHSLVIKLIERKQDYLWCKSAEGDSVDRSCFYMDKEGFIFADSPAFEGNVFLTFFGMIVDTEQTGDGTENNIIGKNFLTKEKMSALIDFVDKLKKFELAPVSINVVSMRDVRVTLQSGSVLILSLEDDLNAVMKNIVTLLQAPEFIKASGGIHSLQYIDLRYGAKAFWKVKSK